jgi:uncharacterized membrane protein
MRFEMWDTEFQKRSLISHRISHIPHLLLLIFLVFSAYCLVPSGWYSGNIKVVEWPQVVVSLSTLVVVKTL